MRGGLLAVLGVGLGLAFMAASGWMNFIFMVGQTRTPVDAFALGVLSIAVTIANALMPFFIRRAWDGQRWLAVAIGALIFPLCLAVSLLSAFGFAAQNRGAAVGGREAVTAAYEAAKRQHNDLQTRLAPLAKARPAAVIEPDIAALKQERAWASSAGCTEVTAAASRAFCKRLEGLKGELASAKTAEGLRKQIEETGRKMELLRGQGAGLDSDPQASLISRLFGVRRAQVQSGWEVLIAVLLELGAAFLPYLAAPEAGWHERAGRQGRGVGEAAAPVTIEAQAIEATEPRGYVPALPRRRNRWIEIAEKNGALRRD